MPRPSVTKRTESSNAVVATTAWPKPWPAVRKPPGISGVAGDGPGVRARAATSTAEPHGASTTASRAARRSAAPAASVPARDLVARGGKPVDDVASKAASSTASKPSVTRSLRRTLGDDDALDGVVVGPRASRRRGVGSPGREADDVGEERRRCVGVRRPRPPRSRARSCGSAIASSVARRSRLRIVPMPSIQLSSTSPVAQEPRRLAGDADPGRRAGEDEVAGQQRHHGRDLGDEPGDGEHEAARAVVLHRLAVDRAAEPEVVGVGQLVGGDQPRPGGSVGRGTTCRARTGRRRRTARADPRRPGRRRARPRGPRPSASATRSARRPITTTSSTSQSTISPDSSIGSNGPPSEAGYLVNTAGTDGSSMPDSAAWLA